MSKFSLVLFSLLLFLTSSCERDGGIFSPEVTLQQHENDTLAELNWLVGSWVDAEEDIDVTLSYRWDPSKHFLLQHFTMKSEDTEPLEGFQIIGWDPAKEKIHSWIFDSEGGFGEGNWFHDDNRWVASVKFTLPDGRIASATHIYTKIDSDTYTFSIENRDVNGSIMPNVGPYKIVRRTK